MNELSNPLEEYWIRAIKELGCEDLHFNILNQLMNLNGSVKIREIYEEKLLYQLAVCNEFGFWNPKLIISIWFLNFPFCIGEDNFILGRFRSIEAANKTLTSLNAERKIIDQIIEIIDEAYLGTQKEKNIEYRIISDIRMHSIGSDYESFIKSLTTARQQYAFMDEKEFFQFECNHFKVILNRGFVYFTPYFKHRFEEVAKQNIKTFLKLSSA